MTRRDTPAATDTASQPGARTSDLAKTGVLIEALPYLQRYAGRTFVVKYGGHAMGSPDAPRATSRRTSCC